MACVGVEEVHMVLFEKESSHLAHLPRFIPPQLSQRSAAVEQRGSNLRRLRFARYSSPVPKGPSFSRSLGFASASLLRELLFETGMIGCLHRYWRRHLPSLARLANPFDEEFPRAPKLKDFVFEGRSIGP